MSENSNASDGGGSDGSGQGGERGDESQGSQTDGQQRQGKNSIEKVTMVISVTFTVLLFAYAGWQAVATPTGTTPEAHVVGTNTLENGSVAVLVELRNPQDVGLLTVTVESECTSPPVELTFENVPADGRETGRLVCPPGTTDPGVSVAAWIEP